MTDLRQRFSPKDFRIGEWSDEPLKLLLETNSRKRHEYHPNDEPKRPAATSGASQFYSMMIAANLKRRYEVENNFEYDLCIRSRFDLVFPDEIPFPAIAENEVATTGGIHVEAFGEFRVDDTFFVARSLTFDRICALFRFMPCIKETAFRNPPSPEFVLHFHMKMFYIRNRAIKEWRPRIKRIPEYVIEIEKRGMHLGDHETL